MGKIYKLVCFAVLFLIFGAFCLGFVFLMRYPIKYKNFVSLYASSEIAPELIYGVIKAESGFNAKAESSAGALGLMQIKPSTANYMAEIYNLPVLKGNEDLFNPQLNIQFGTLYLKYLYNKFNGDITHVLVAYNAGETITREWVNSGEFEALAYKQSLDYAKKVTKYAKIYKKLL